MKVVKSIFEDASLEDRLFLVVLLFAIPYFTTSTISAYFVLHDFDVIRLNLILLALTTIMLVLARRKERRKPLIYLFCTLATIAFIYFWSFSGGLVGAGAYVFPSLSVLVVLMTKGKARLAFATMLTLVIIILSLGWVEVSGAIIYGGLLTDYLLNVIVFAAILILFKRSFDKEREKLIQRNNEINELNKQLLTQADELNNYNHEIKTIQNNLQVIIEQRTQKWENERARIIDFTFINAHLVRAPIANIMGLTQLIVHENPQLKELDESIHELDDVVRKIGDVLKQK